MVVFIDESGTLPDVADKYIVLVALIAHNPQELKTILPKFRKKIPEKGSRKKEKTLRELKFHYVGDITRKKVLEEINTKNIKIYALAVDKMGRKIADTPTNFGKLIKSLIKILRKKEDVKDVYIDKHFGNKDDTNKLKLFLESNIKADLNLEQIDSIEDSRIDLADFVAGAIFRKYRISDLSFYNIIATKITKETKVKWNVL